MDTWLYYGVGRMSSTKLSLDQVYTIGDKELTGEEIYNRLEMFEVLYAFAKSERERVCGGK